jgi:uncharacterized protein (DUF302 family)
MKKLIALCLYSAAAVAASDAQDHSPEAPVVVYPAAEEYDLVKENLELAITDRGMLISGTLHVGDMLNRTGKDLGFPKAVFKNAESIEFCSALMSHRMMSADASNLVLCPFTLAVYIKTAEPDQVYVAYRKPLLAGESAELAKAVTEMLDDIAREAIQ